MANEWIQSGGASCYNSAIAGFAFSQNGPLEIGKVYSIDFTVLDMTQGKLVLDSIEGKPEYTEDGVYHVVGIALSNTLTFIGDEYQGDVFDGCIDDVGSRFIPFITIKDLEGNVVFEQTDDSIVSASGDNIQYDIDWSEIEEGCYKIYFSQGIDYVSDCIDLKLTHGCTLLLSWTNNENAFGFNYEELSFSPQLRVKAKLWQPSYTKEKDVFKDNAGNRTILKSETSKEELLTIGEVPEYIHDAVAIGVEHDNFYVDGVKYTNEETEYTPKWRKSSQLAPSELVIIKDQFLRNNNC
jgi:hypothetical protein